MRIVKWANLRLLLTFKLSLAKLNKTCNDDIKLCRSIVTKLGFDIGRLLLTNSKQKRKRKLKSKDSNSTALV